MAGLAHHEDEVGDRGAVDRAAGAGPQHDGDLRDHPAGADVAEEDVGVAGQRDHALLDAGPAGVVEPDDRAAHAHGQIHHLDDLLGEDLAEAAAEHGEVLAEHADPAAVDRAVAGDDAVAPGAVVLEAEPVGAVTGEHVQLGERSRVEQQVDPLAGGQLAAGVLARDRILASRAEGLFAQLPQPLALFLDRHRTSARDLARHFGIDQVCRDPMCGTPQRSRRLPKRRPPPGSRRSSRAPGGCGRPGPYDQTVPDDVTLTVLVFAALRERLGAGPLRGPRARGCPAGAALAARCPSRSAGTAAPPGVRYAVNDAWANEAAPLADGDRVAIIAAGVRRMTVPVLTASRCAWTR